MNRNLLKASIVTLLSAIGVLTMTAPPAHGQVIAVAAAVWGWRNLVAPNFGGPWIAPDVRFRPFEYREYRRYDELPPPQGQAQINVKVPDANAQVWVQGMLLRGT